MKKLFLVLLGFSLHSVIYGQTFDWSLAYSFGSTNYDGAEDVIADSAGNIYISGTFYDTVDFDPGPGVSNLISNATNGGIFLIKLNAAGNLLWACKWDQQYLGVYSYPFRLNFDGNGNILFTGYFSNSFDFDPGPGTNIVNAIGSLQYFILKLNAAGNFVWVRTFGGLNNTPQCYSKVNSSGDIFLAGHFHGNFDFDPGAGTYNMNAPNRDIFIMKLNPSGNFVWAKHTTGSLNTWVNDLKLDNAGNLMVTGSFSGTTDFDPGTATLPLQQEQQLLMKIFMLPNSRHLVY